MTNVKLELSHSHVPLHQVQTSTDLQVSSFVSAPPKDRDHGDEDATLAHQQLVPEPQVSPAFPAREIHRIDENLERKVKEEQGLLETRNDRKYRIEVAEEGMGTQPENVESSPEGMHREQVDAEGASVMENQEDHTHVVAMKLTEDTNSQIEHESEPENEELMPILFAPPPPISNESSYHILEEVTAFAQSPEKQTTLPPAVDKNPNTQTDTSKEGMPTEMSSEIAWDKEHRRIASNSLCPLLATIVGSTLRTTVSEFSCTCSINNPGYVGERVFNAKGMRISCDLCASGHHHEIDDHITIQRSFVRIAFEVFRRPKIPAPRSFQQPMAIFPGHADNVMTRRLRAELNAALIALKVAREDLRIEKDRCAA